MDTNLILTAHSVLAIVALVIYVIRGGMMVANSKSTNSRSMLTAASFTILIVFGLGVYLGFQQKLSFADGYMLSKIIGLLLFVGFGVIALKHGLAKGVAIILWLLGLAAFAYTFAIAKQHMQPIF